MQQTEQKFFVIMPDINFKIWIVDYINMVGL